MTDTVELDINEILDDESKYFANLYNLQENDEVNEIRSSFNDSQYYSESELKELMNNNTYSDSNQLKLFSLNIANILTKLSSFKILIQNISNSSSRPNIISIT